MIPPIVRAKFRLGLFPFLNLLGPDKVDKITETEINTDLSVLSRETGWDRVRRIFQVDEFGNVSYEANSIVQVAAMSMFVGAVYGGVMSSRTAYLDFMRNNQATTFKNHLEAKKKLQDKVTISFGKGAFKFSWRLTLFTTSFVGIATIIQAYRGKAGIIEYVAAGGTSGFLYKFNLGPRGWIVGSGLGSALGLLCGGATMAALYLTGISMEEARYWQYHWKDSRSQYFKKGVAEYLEKEDFAVLKLHNDRVDKEAKDSDNKNKVINVSDHNKSDNKK